MLNKSSPNSKALRSGSEFLMILLATSAVLIPLGLNRNQTAIAQQQQDEETAYLKFAAQTIKESNNGKNVTTSTTQIPEAAKGPPIPAKGYLVQQIRDHLYWVTDGSYNTVFLVTDKGVVAVDAPPSIGKNYLKAIAEVTDKPVAYVIYSHAHLDHIGAAGIFPKTATFYSSTRNCS
jgi:alkyl sulfatase BDS1-like metallo-beta-lactamase superfamily hydrolase